MTIYLIRKYDGISTSSSRSTSRSRRQRQRRRRNRRPRNVSSSEEPQESSTSNQNRDSTSTTYTLNSPSRFLAPRPVPPFLNISSFSLNNSFASPYQSGSSLNLSPISRRSSVS